MNFNNEEVTILKEMIALFTEKKSEDAKMAIVMEREKELSDELHAAALEHKETLDALATEIELSKKDCEMLSYNPDATPVEKEEAQARYDAAMLARKQAIEALTIKSKEVEAAHREKYKD